MVQVKTSGGSGRACSWSVMTEPHGHGARFICLKQLMNPGRTDADGPRDLPDGQPGLLGRYDSPNSFTLGVGRSRYGKAEPRNHLLFAADTLVQGFRGFHVYEDTRFSLNCTEN